MKATLLQSQTGDWEGLFINGVLVDEAHELGAGERSYWVKSTQRYNYDIDDLEVIEVNDIDEEYLCDCGSFPTNLYELNGQYES